MKNKLAVVMLTSIVVDNRSIAPGTQVELDEKLAVRLAYKRNAKPIDFDPFDPKYADMTEDLREKFGPKDSPELSIARTDASEPETTEAVDEDAETTEAVDEDAETRGGGE